MAQNLKFFQMEAAFARPANTTAYGANKVVADATSGASVLTFKIVNPGTSSQSQSLVAGGSYQIKTAHLSMNTSGTTNASFDLYVYSSGVTAFNDNTNFTLGYGDKHIAIGKISFSLSTGDTNSSAKEQVVSDINHTFIATGANIYGILVASAAYTPGSGENVYCRLNIMRLDS